MKATEWLNYLESGSSFLSALYGAEDEAFQKARYARLARGIIEESAFPAAKFPETRTAEARFFTAAGRTELGGNHTDHNNGKVLAAAIQLDAVALVCPRGDNRVFFHSEGFPDVEIDITDKSIRTEEAGAAESLIRGVAAGLAELGVPVKGWTANAGSAVLPGSGLSSSAAMETLAAKIFDGLYGGGALSAMTLALVSQKAENLYYGKPSGLMDQAASASGGAVAIDFAQQPPLVTRTAFSPEDAGFALCVVDTRGSHADLTPDYAAIPAEMRKTAAFFGKNTLGELSESEFLGVFSNFKRISALRAAVGDRAILRARHFFDENARVTQMLAELQHINLLASDYGSSKSVFFDKYLNFVNKSGDSSWKLLQNLYSTRSPEAQGLPLALALTRAFINGKAEGRGACRVHGGGFAGTIQAYIPLISFIAYKDEMETVFGAAAVTRLKVRQIGTAEITPQPL